MTIGSVSKAAGVPQSSIRFYESVGLLSAPARKNGIRQYDEDVIDQLKILRFFRANGIPIRDLAAIVSQRPGSEARRAVWLEVLQNRIVDLESSMKKAQKTKRLLEETIECHCEGDRNRCSIFATPS